MPHGRPGGGSKTRNHALCACVRAFGVQCRLLIWCTDIANWRTPSLRDKRSPIGSLHWFTHWFIWARVRAVNVHVPMHVRVYSDFSIFLFLLFVLSGCLCLLVTRSVCRRSVGRVFGLFVCLLGCWVGCLSVGLCVLRMSVLILLSVLVKFNIFLPF